MRRIKLAVIVTFSLFVLLAFPTIVQSRPPTIAQSPPPAITQSKQPTRIIFFHIDGLHYQAPERLKMTN